MFLAPAFLTSRQYRSSSLPLLVSALSPVASVRSCARHLRPVGAILSGAGGSEIWAPKGGKPPPCNAHRRPPPLQRASRPNRFAECCLLACLLVSTNGPPAACCSGRVQRTAAHSLLPLALPSCSDAMRREPLFQTAVAAVEDAVAAGIAAATAPLLAGRRGGSGGFADACCPSRTWS